MMLAGWWLAYLRGGGSKGPDLASAKEMIAAGDLAGARRLYTSFTGTAGEEKNPVALQVA